MSENELQMPTDCTYVQNNQRAGIISAIEHAFHYGGTVYTRRVPAALLLDVMLDMGRDNILSIEEHEDMIRISLNGEVGGVVFVCLETTGDGDE